MCKNVSLADLLRRQYLFKILQAWLTLLKVKGNVVKTGCFEKRLLWRAPIFFRNEGGTWILVGRYLFEILHTSSTVKTSSYVVDGSF